MKVLYLCFPKSETVPGTGKPDGRKPVINVNTGIQKKGIPKYPWPRAYTSA